MCIKLGCIEIRIQATTLRQAVLFSKAWHCPVIFLVMKQKTLEHHLQSFKLTCGIAFFIH